MKSISSITCFSLLTVTYAFAQESGAYLLSEDFVSSSEPTPTEQNIGFVSGSPDVQTSPLVTFPVGLGSAEVGPTQAEAEAFRGEFTGLWGSGTSEGRWDVFRTVPQVFAFTDDVDPDATQGNPSYFVGAESNAFSDVGQQIWVVTHSDPLEEWSNSSYVSFLTSEQWVSSSGGALGDPSIFMNTQFGDVFFGDVGSGVIQMAAIPEPATYATLFGLVVLSGAILWRRKSRLLL